MTIMLLTRQEMS